MDGELANSVALPTVIDAGSFQSVKPLVLTLVKILSATASPSLIVSLPAILVLPETSKASLIITLPLLSEIVPSAPISR